jgi:hypothetical protein
MRCDTLAVRAGIELIDLIIANLDPASAAAHRCEALSRAVG